MIKMLFSCGLLLCAALLPSCQRKALQPAVQGSPATPGPSADSAVPVTPQPFSFSLSSGGGFTGQISGFTLASDGTVKEWERRGAGADSTLWETRIPAGRILDFRKRLEQGGAKGISLQGSGNMTTLVKLQLPDTLYLWSWSGTGVSESVPEPFRSWYPEVRGFCENLKSTTPKAPSRPHGK
jgi:hypothetical protein